MTTTKNAEDDAALSATKWNTGLGVVGTVVTILAAWWGSANPSLLLYVTVGEAVLLIILYVVIVRLKANAIDLRAQVPRNVPDRQLYLDFHDRIMKKLGTAIRELHSSHLRLYGDEVRQGQVALVQHLQESSKSDRTMYAVDLTDNIPLVVTRNDYFVQNEALIRAGGTVRRIFVVKEDKLNDANEVTRLYQLMKQHHDAGVEVGLQIQQAIRDAQLLQDFIVFGNSAAIVEGQQAGMQYEYGHSQVYFDQPHIESYRRIFDTLWRGVVGPNSRLLAKRFLQQGQAVYEKQQAGVDIEKLIRSNE